MAKINLYNKMVVRERFVLREKNVTLISVANFGTRERQIMVNGIVRTLPAIDANLNIPNAPFALENSGHHFDIEIEIEAVTEVLPFVDKLVIDYAVINLQDTTAPMSTNKINCKN